MSNYVIYSEPKNIPQKKYYADNYSYNYPGSDHFKYLFELIIKFEDGKKKVIRKIESVPECEIINEKNQIEYNNLNYFQLSIAQIPFKSVVAFDIEGEIENDNNDLFIQSDNNIYIEFIKKDVNVICTCKLLNLSQIYGTSPNC
jgi:hypothetical protein